MFKKMCLFLIIFVLITIPSFVFATNIETSSGNDIIINNDFYLTSSEDTEITKMLLGNAFINTKNFVLSPHNEGGVISGDLFINSNSVILKSDAIYDENGNLSSVNTSSKIFGNVFAITNKFVMEPGSSIENDLIIIAKDVEISEDASIYGNVYIFSNNVKIAGQVIGNCYIKSSNFSLEYTGLLLQDLYLKSSSADFKGIVKRNAFINSNDLKITDICEIYGNLNYSSYQELEISSDIVLGQIEYSKLSKIDLSKIIIFLVAVVLYIFLFYILITKLFTSFCEKFSNYTLSNFIKSFGLGILIFMLIPVIVILLCLAKFGYIIALALFFVYGFFIFLSLPIFITSISKMLKLKFEAVPEFLFAILLALCLCGILFIPFANIIIYALLIIIGIGEIFTK